MENGECKMKSDCGRNPRQVALSGGALAADQRKRGGSFEPPLCRMSRASLRDEPSRQVGVTVEARGPLPFGFGDESIWNSTPWPTDRFSN